MRLPLASLVLTGSKGLKDRVVRPCNEGAERSSGNPGRRGGLEVSGYRRPFICRTIIAGGKGHFPRVTGTLCMTEVAVFGSRLSRAGVMVASLVRVPRCGGNSIAGDVQRNGGNNT